MFERFTESARQVIVLAQHESTALGHDYIGTEHLLLALLAEGCSLASDALGSLGLTHAAVQDAVLQMVGRGPGGHSGHIPFTPRSKTVLELAQAEASEMGSIQIGAEHLLLGVIREGGGVASGVLIGRGASLTDVREAVLRAITSEMAREPIGRGDAVAVQLARLEQKVDQIAVRLAALAAQPGGPEGTS
jgi:ATP-dependent Clp protease ATP-binding subunit ClpC